MARVLIKKARYAEVDGKRKVVSEFEKHYVDPSKDFHMRLGKIPKEELQKKSGSTIMLGSNEFIVFDADFIDDYKHMRRLAQIITLKDIGAIIANAGITRDSKIMEAGSGSGAVSCYLSRIAKRIVSYDIDQRSLEVTRENVARYGAKNVSVKEGNIYDPKQVSERGFDLLLLDVPEPHHAIATASKVLRIGGFVATYAPNVTQIQEFVKALPESFLIERCIELIEREWAVDERRTRPATKDHAHTGFMAFARKIQ